MKALIAIVIVALLGIGWYAFNNHQTALKEADTQNPPSMFLSANFNCVDNTHFIAEFPSANDVKIVVDGVTARILPKVPGDGQRFEDGEYVYVFAGEEATVTEKTTGTTTTCAQPFDANNAPVNFGDAAEGGGVKPDTTLVVSESIVGKWQSTEDNKFVREFKADGTAVDTYDSKDPHEGTWTVFTKDKPLDVKFPIEESATYLQLSIKDNSTDVLHFKISALTPESLELIFMDRGGSLKFTRIQ
jgi:membrane-bound inhibitor of C-type lysozyme